MRKYIITTVIEVDEDQLPTETAIRDKIMSYLNRGDGIWMEVSKRVFRIIPLPTP